MRRLRAPATVAVPALRTSPPPTKTGLTLDRIADRRYAQSPPGKDRGVPLRNSAASIAGSHMGRQEYRTAQAMIATQLDRLHRRSEALRIRAIRDIVDTMSRFHISVEELQAAQPRPRNSKAKGATPAARRASTPKYADPATGQTWTGRGPAPNWLRTYEEAGRDRASFLVQPAPHA